MLKSKGCVGINTAVSEQWVGNMLKKKWLLSQQNTLKYQCLHTIAVFLKFIFIGGSITYVPFFPIDPLDPAPHTVAVYPLLP